MASWEISLLESFFFVIGQVILYVFGDKICEGAAHYLDGLFFATICNLLAVMMVYKVRGFSCQLTFCTPQYRELIHPFLSLAMILFKISPVNSSSRRSRPYETRH